MCLNVVMSHIKLDVHVMFTGTEVCYTCEYSQRMVGGAKYLRTIGGVNIAARCKCCYPLDVVAVAFL